MKEKILEAFDQLGFQLEESQKNCYGFDYEGLNLLYMYSENDEEFLSISLPGIFDLEEGNTLQICALLEKINSSLKYVKAYLMGDEVWLFYERELLGEDNLRMVISHMVLHLEAGVNFARKTMAELEKSMSSRSSCEEGVTDDAEEIVDGDDNE